MIAPPRFICITCLESCKLVTVKIAIMIIIDMIDVPQPTTDIRLNVPALFELSITVALYSSIGFELGQVIFVQAYRVYSIDHKI